MIGMSEYETHRWVENTDVCMENSFGPVRSGYTEMEFIVSLRKNKYGATVGGSFELYDTDSGGDEYYGEGGLWFRDNILVDYDGVYSLMPQIVRKLKKLGLGIEGEEE